VIVKEALAPVRRAVQASPAQRAMRTLPVPSTGRLVRSGVVRSGVAVGASVVALSAASAVATAIRRRAEGS
jgi:hypothetical protein